MYSPFMQGPWHGGMFAGTLAALFIAVALWAIAWKGLALWNAARNRQFVWFVALLVVNTAGILDIAYLLFFRTDREKRSFASLFNADGLRAKTAPKAAGASAPSADTKANDLPVAESSPAE